MLPQAKETNAEIIKLKSRNIEVGTSVFMVLKMTILKKKQ